jgi:DNA-binding response OmpR family regulator
MRPPPGGSAQGAGSAPGGAGGSSKEELLDGVWAYRGPSKTRTLDSHASRLRRKLDPQGRFVINCWGIGYRLIDG